MRRIFRYLSCSVLLLGSLLMANAQGSITVTVDTKSPNNLVTADIKDTPIETVLTELFYGTGGKYHVLIGEGVTGTIDELTIAQDPFDTALNEILSKAASPTTFTKTGANLYLVKAVQTAPVVVPTETTTVTPTVTKAPEPGAETKIPFIKVKMKDTSKTTLAATTGTTATTGIPGLVSTTPGQTAEEPAPKDYYFALITVNNFPVSQISQQFGFDYIASFSNANNSNGYGGGGGYGNNNSNYGYNNSGYNNNGYNNNGYNNNGYNNNGYNNNGYGTNGYNNNGYLNNGYNTNTNTRNTRNNNRNNNNNNGMYNPYTY